MAKASFDPQEFRSALSTFTTGVTIITTRAENGDPVGITVESTDGVVEPRQVSHELTVLH